MNEFASRVWNIAEDQRGVIANWQLAQRGWSREEVKAGLRGLRRLYRGVCAIGDVDELGWYLASAWAMGPSGAISHLSGLMLTGLRPFEAGDIHVSYRGGHREPRPGLVPHRRRTIERDSWLGIPVASAAQCLADAELLPHQLYRALEVAERRGWSLPDSEVSRLKQAVTGYTRSDTEARFLWLCHENRFPLPLVNQHLNGFETDFHWPDRRLVVEVDGFEHHKERPAFNRDRYRGLVHRVNGFEVIRVSADDVYDRPELVLAAIYAGGG